MSAHAAWIDAERARERLARAVRRNRWRAFAYVAVHVIAAAALGLGVVFVCAMLSG